MSTGIPKKAKGSKKNRKHGHNKRKPGHLRALNEHRIERHREARLKAHLATHPNDSQARRALND